MAWDASRIAAAIPSGVGFLGAGMIWKQSQEDGGQTVHGLTTAASLWLSAAVGIAAGEKQTKSPPHLSPHLLFPYLSNFIFFLKSAPTS